MKKSVLLLLLSALFTCGSVYAQLRVTGTVLDAATGEPMAGASVIEQGTTSGTTTDTKGRFAISVKNHQSVLTFSFIGMVPQNIMVGSNTDLRVELQQDVTQIENVVVQIGYGDAQKKNVAGSLGVLSTSEITKSKGTSFMDALQGRMAGVQVSSSSGEPGAGIDITIRGGNSINAGTQPLYIIDDVQIDVNADEVATSSYTSANVRYNPLAGINPSDIESITVLKDASATAIYGSRGANGVVIITTKSGRGEKGLRRFRHERRSGPDVEYDRRASGTGVRGLPFRQVPDQRCVGHRHQRRRPARPGEGLLRLPQPQLAGGGHAHGYHPEL